MLPSCNRVTIMVTVLVMEKLYAWRKANELSAEAAGKLIGVGKVQWLRLETGERKPAPERVLLIESITGISRHELRPDVFGNGLKVLERKSA